MAKCKGRVSIMLVECQGSHMPTDYVYQVTFRYVDPLPSYYIGYPEHHKWFICDSEGCEIEALAQFMSWAKEQQLEVIPTE